MTPDVAISAVGVFAVLSIPFVVGALALLGRYIDDVRNDR